jgi:hypothetical protein
MVVSIVRGRAAAVLTAAVLGVTLNAGFARAADGDALATEITSLVEQLDSGTPSERAAAERSLVELGLTPGKGESLLALLPAPNDDMSQEAATRLARIRGEVQTRMAEAAVAETRVTLDVTDAPLDEVLATIEKQTGNQVVDYREQLGAEAPEKKVTLKVEDEPFWSALDRLLDATNMSPYAFGENESSLALVERQEGTQSRVGKATYAGPFRIETTRVGTQRSLRMADQNNLEVDLEISWEPRLRPVALSQSAEDFKAQGDDGADVPTTAQNDVFNVEVTAGSHSAEVTAPMELPARAVKEIASLKGRLAALVPGRLADLRFDKLAGAKDAVQEVGGVKVTLSRVVQNQALWEIHMRIRVGSIDDSAETSRGWVFQNITFMEGKDGETIDHAGFETTMQNDEEAGFAYFFELPEGADIGDYTWVYRTPAAIVNLPVEYEIKGIPLP